MLPTNPLLSATAPAGPHLPAATLRQYAAGTLSPTAQHRVEAHTLACPRCADMLEGLLQTAPATTDQALAQLQQRLRRRVQQAPAALPAVRTRPRHRLMALQLAAAAALLFGLVAGGWWTWQQRHAAPTTAARPTAPRPAAAPVAPTAKVPAPAVAVRAASPAVGAVAAARAVRRRLPHLVASRRLARPATARSAAPTAATNVPTASVAAAAPVAVAPDAAREALAEAMAPPAPAAANALVASRAAYDSSAALTPGLLGRVPGVAVGARAGVAAPALVRAEALPAAAAIAPAPVGGYGAWRERLRRAAAEFKPEAPEQPLSGSVQLRLLIGADGKIQEIRVLHGLRADYDEEAQRLVCDGANWVPGIGGGKRAAQLVDVAVPFQ